MSSSTNTSTEDHAAIGPASAWLFAGLLLTGIGTVILGPLLPHLAASWRLTDAQSGALFAAKFVGASCGGISVPRRVRIGLASGALLSLLGFAGLGFCTGVVSGGIALAVSGFGIGQMIVATNILAARRYREHTGSALAILNFFWSLGAMLAGALVGALLPHTGLRVLMLGFAATFFIVGLGDELSITKPAVAFEPKSESSEPAAFPTRIFIFFALILFLYGGLETGVSDWLTTYSLRYGGARLLDGQSAIILFWMALTTGRALSSLVLRRVGERTMQLAGISCAALFVLALMFAHSALGLSAATIFLGLALSAYFPVTFGLLMRWNPRPAQAGIILAASGIGAASFLWLTGAVSTHFGSLRIAMSVQLALAVALVIVSLRLPLASARPLTPAPPFPEARGV